MKQTLKTLIRNVKSINGNSLAEFATVTALMATLAATAAPKLSEMSEGAKGQKSTDELDKLVKQAGQFYQDTADNEGRGRFPGQDKYNLPVTGGSSVAAGTITDYAATSGTESAHETAILNDIGDGGTYITWKTVNSGWVSVFGKDNTDFPAPAEHTIAPDDLDGVATACNTCPQVDTIGKEEWLLLFGGEPMGSQFQDGHFVYQVVAGYGSGNNTYPPVLYVADIENAANFNNVLEP